MRRTVRFRVRPVKARQEHIPIQQARTLDPLGSQPVHEGNPGGDQILIGDHHLMGFRGVQEAPQNAQVHYSGHGLTYPPTTQTPANRKRFRGFTTKV